MRRPEPAKPDINVTPLVDVVLVLLIIFMVIVPQMEAGASVSVPGVSHPDTKTDPQHAPLTLSVTAAGKLFLEKVPVDRDRLVAELTRAHAAAPGRRLVLKGDRAARWADLRALFRECRRIGFPGVALQVGDKRKGERKD